MKLDFALLRTIHRILKQKTDLKDRIEKGPRRIVAAENAEKQISADVDAAKEIKTKTQMAADAKQLQLSEREARIEDLKNKLNTAGSNKEFQLLKDQIAADEQANLVLSDEILEMLERIDELETAHRTAEENYAKAKDESEKIRKRINDELATLNEQLESVVAELVENEKKLTGEVGAEYRRQASSRGEEALAETDMQTCGNCYTKMTTQAMSELMMQNAVFCQSCHSLLYVSEKVTTN